MREFINGAAAIVRGALTAGCDFFAGYPITPATPILLNMLQLMPATGGIAVQGEDEISSIGMCIGAGLTGRRPMTATSGPGLSLFSENIGLALMAEVPLVIVDVQRLGPATGGATTVGQGDVQMVRWLTGGGYPLIVLAPSSVAECYTLTIEAFSMASRFRCPVIVLSDKEINLTTTTVILEESVHPCASDLVAPSPPFFGDGVVRHVTGSSHDAKGRITKDKPTVQALNNHLWAKIMDHTAEIERAHMDLQTGAETLFISYGITARSMEAAVTRCRLEGQRVSSLTLHSLWPVPVNVLKRCVPDIKRIVIGELNPGLYAREIRGLFPGIDTVNLQRIDGGMIRPETFVSACF
ncbi:MAG: pyruvate flavodoxin/ferredoxin oxidoreductase [Anaerolineae bacterium]|nr:pyruvate flavodoxin/ferredoxin oxidoreductase [Anaerolineae bacterium]